MSEKLVSVIMSVYNEKEEWLRKSIESILKQTYKSLQFIIVLDNPDNKLAKTILEEYKLKDSRLICLYNSSNKGLVWSLNNALNYVKGDYIARMDADDISSENRIMEEMKIMQDNNVDFVTASIQLIDESEVYITKSQYKDINALKFNKIMKFGNISTHPTWLVKRTVYENLLGYREVKYCEDVDFVIRAIQKGFKCYRTEKILLQYRIRGAGISKSFSIEQDLKARYLRRLYRKGNLIEEQDVADINNKFFGSSSNKQYTDAIIATERISINLTKKKYKNTIRIFLKEIISNNIFRRNFIENAICYLLLKYYL